MAVLRNRRPPRMHPGSTDPLFKKYPPEVVSYFLRRGVPNIEGKTGVSGGTRLLPGTLAHAVVVLHNAFSLAMKPSTMDEHIKKKM